jgi:large subunit ribosomal protein L25
MNHETPTLVASKRERLGTRYAQRLRKTGQLPAVIYGHGADPISVSVDGKKTLAHLHHGQHVFNLEIEGEGTETCLVKDLQFGFLGDNVIHLDLTRVNLDERVKILVHLDLHGELKTANDPGAIVMHDYAEIEVECAVRDIPESIRVDLEEYESSINVGELKLPEGMVAITPADTNIIHVQIAAEEPEELADEAPSEAPSDPSSDADAPKSED